MGRCLVPPRCRRPRRDSSPPIALTRMSRSTSWTEVIREFRDSATGFLGSFPDLRVEPIRSFEDGRIGVLEWEMGGRHVGEFDGLAPTHRQSTVRGVTVLDIEDDGDPAVRPTTGIWAPLVASSSPTTLDRMINEASASHDERTRGAAASHDCFARQAGASDLEGAPASTRRAFATSAVEGVASA